MKEKRILGLAVSLLVSGHLFAGGYLTNTNQNAAFVRNFAQEGMITLTSVYANPAGGGFLSNGWHLSLNGQMAIQQRNIETTFPLFQQNANDPDQTHKFKGKAVAPFIPSFTLTYNQDKWSLSAHFAVVGGGGKCEFKEGLGSFETIGASIAPQVVSGIAQVLMAPPYNLPAATAATTAANAGPNSYTMNSSMKGNSYYFGLQVGGTYKFMDNLIGYLGLRGVYAQCSYNGFVGDLTLANAKTGATALPPTMGGTPYIDLVRQKYGNVDPVITLNCDQTGFGVCPIVGVDWEINNHWNVAAKYEFRTVINLENSSQMSDMAKLLAGSEQGKALGQFADGEKVREDIPALLALGVQYSPIPTVRLCAAYHEFFDKSSKKYDDKQKLIDHNTREILFGAEYDINKLVTISGSWERTFYGQSDAFMSDLSYNLTNSMIGCGVRLHPSKYFNVDLGYMCTFYKDREVTTQTAAGPKTDLYKRTNHTIGVGFNLYLSR